MHARWLGATQRMFDRRGHGYHSIAWRVARRLYRGVAAEVAAGGLAEGAAVLDIGTGPGHLLAEIAALRPDLRLTGIDLSPTMIEVARQTVAGNGVRLDIGDAARMPYPDGSFDLIVSTISLHHWQEPERVAAEAFRVLRPGGRLWVYDVALIRFAPFTGGVEKSFGTAPARDVKPFGPLGLPLIARFAATRRS
jgi:ubiquinone/menaquinone biosynthesis C-methylase UbiE